MRFSCLGTGSRANATVIVQDSAAILVDCGFQPKELLARLRAVGVPPMNIKGIVISHDHADHCAGAVPLAEMLRVPIYGSPGTLSEMLKADLRRLQRLGLNAMLPCNGVSGSMSVIGGMSVSLFSVPHDSAEPAGILVSTESEAIAICMDLGNISEEVAAQLDRAERIVLDCNHDLDMLEAAPYAPALKKRIAGPQGHLNNSQVAEFLEWRKFEKVVLAHLSEASNDSLLARSQMPCDVEVSTQDQPTQWW